MINAYAIFNIFLPLIIQLTVGDINFFAYMRVFLCERFLEMEHLDKCFMYFQFGKMVPNSPNRFLNSVLAEKSDASCLLSLHFVTLRLRDFPCLPAAPS